MSKFFTPRTKMADALEVNYNLLLLLPRLGIQFGFGDRNIDEVCLLNHASASFVVMVFNCYTFRDYEPCADKLTSDDARQMAAYLVASHHYYINERIPHLERHLDHVAQQAGSRQAAALRQFFEGYSDEVKAHFAHEEQHIFPLIADRIEGRMVHAAQVGDFASSHDSMVDKLSDLMQIIFKYLPTNGLAEELNELAFTILQFSSDLRQHALIEDKVMLPYLLRKEASHQ